MFQSTIPSIGSYGLAAALWGWESYKKGSENLEKCQVESEEHRKNRILPPSLETRSQKHHHTQKNRSRQL